MPQGGPSRILVRMIESFSKKCIFGVLTFLALLIVFELALRITGTCFTIIQEYNNFLAKCNKADVRILCLGESTTAGGWGSYPTLLRKCIDRDGNGKKIQVINKGVVNTTTGGIALMIEKYIKEYHPDIMIAMMGINDFQEQPDEHVTLRAPWYLHLRLVQFWDAVYRLSQAVMWKWLPHSFDKPKLSAQLFMRDGDYESAEEVFMRRLQRFPEADRSWGSLGALYLERNKREQADECFSRARDIRMRLPKPYTTKNCQFIEQVASKHNIPLVVLQYPLRSVNELRELFKNPEDVIFVSNEKVFKDAVAQGGYFTYFIDMFGGEFGHCTVKGNKLLAENVKESIKDLIQRSPGA
jgi:lysophospholipase L1-like esterase